MTRRRLLFEYWHKWTGIGTALLAWAVTVLGLVTADAPRWMVIVIACWWAFLILLMVFFERRGQCLDTYQAIWGPDTRHPGNQRMPIGFRVRRVEPGNPDS